MSPSNRQDSDFLSLSELIFAERKEKEEPLDMTGDYHGSTPEQTEESPHDNRPVWQQMNDRFLRSSRKRKR